MHRHCGLVPGQYKHQAFPGLDPQSNGFSLNPNTSQDKSLIQSHAVTDLSEILNLSDQYMINQIISESLFRLAKIRAGIAKNSIKARYASFLLGLECMLMGHNSKKCQWMLND